MSEVLVSRKRTPLSGKIKQKFIDVNGNSFYWDITILGVRGEGGSCLCYDVEVEKGPMNQQRMILKQFYPDLAGEHEISASLDGTELTIDYLEQRPDIVRLAERFEEAFYLQNRLASELECVVKPSVNYFSGMTKLVLYEANTGASLDRFIEEEPENLLEMLDVIAETAESLHSVHQAGYIHMDIKPENILWSHGRVKLFDFDASVCREEKTSVYAISHDGREGKEQTLAPELRNHGDKRALLTPKVDIYSLGCILFEYIMGRCPTDEECFRVQHVRDAFHDKIHDVYDAQFEWKHQEELFQIVSKCIQFDRAERYDTGKEMAEDLRALSKKVRTYQKRRYRQADNNLLSGYVLDTFPVFKYKYKKDESFQIDVALIGNAAIRDDFLKSIFSCSQMIHTQLHIRVYAPDAKQYMEQLLAECPQLKDTAYFYLNQGEQKYLDTALNENITKEPFAYFYFYENELNGDAVAEIFKPETRYFLVVDDTIKNNKTIAKALISQLEEKTSKRVFVGYGRRGNGGCSVETDLVSSANHVHVQAFCCDSNVTKREKLFKTDIYRKALGVHTFYTKDWNEKMEKSKIKADFEQKDSMGNFYNLKSSLRCALSIKYKYDACDIPVNLDDAKVFYEKVVLQNTPEARKLYDKLVYLEHRSWMCFMIMEGYRCPTDAELELYFYRDGNDHRNKKEKLHPCICGSYFNVEKNLKGLSFSQWNSEAVYADVEYDALDRMSLRIHRMAEKRTRELNLEKEFSELREYLELAEEKEELLAILERLHRTYERMLAAENEINVIWDRTYAEMAGALDVLKASGANEVLKKIKGKMAVVKERNSYHDYKMTDAVIIDAIPRIMMAEKEVYARIYKTPSKNIGDMIISVMLMEPDELVLIYDEDSTETMEHMRTITAFLKERGLGHIQVSVSCYTEIQCKKKNKKSVLDITGCSERFMMKLLSQGFLTNMPVVRCEDGKVLPQVNADDVRYYIQPRHLTVNETFSLFKARIQEEESTNYMLSLNHIYKQLWQAYVEINSGALWGRLSVLIQAKEKENYWKLPKLSELGEAAYCETTMIYTLLIKMSKIDEVLAQLKELGYIEEYEFPPREVEEGRIILKCDSKICALVRDMVKQVKRESSHKFSIVKKSDALHIYDDCLSVVCPIDVKEKKEISEALTILCDYGRKDGQEYIIKKVDGYEFAYTRGDGTVEMAFKFANRAVKECLLREGNVLEVYAYNTVLQQCKFYDVRSNVIFFWDTERENRVKNELDLVCTYGMQTFFVSCKKTKADNSFLTEIKYLADYFGINAKAIILCSHNATGSHEFYDSDTPIWERSKAMDVYYVNHSLIGENKEDIENGKLAEVFRAIVSGKKDWWNV